ncbi:MAG: glycine cleavage system protein GcvH [Candidatus Dormibacteraeota bacterium]|nr:glycine cleavage system protein GcvH [Candidatus Dormibacteraeota bacterium]
MPDLSGYRFSATHEWVRTEGEEATIGISEHAQSQLGDVIFLELPDVGAKLSAGDKFGVVESVKAASDLYAPVSGTVSAVNDRLATNPELVNTDPYGDGWMLKLSGAEGGENLMDEARYTESTA